MTVSFKVAEQPSELNVHISGLSANALVSDVLMYLIIII